MKFLPSILFNNIFDPVSRDEKKVIDYYKRINELNYYKSYENRLIFNQEKRKEYADFIDQNNLSSTIWITSNLSSQDYNLSNINLGEQNKAIDYMKQLIDLSVESNAEFIGFTSGKRLDNYPIEEQQERFEDALFKLLDYTSQYQGVKLLLEPLDTHADKKHTVGESSYVKKLADKVKRYKLDINFTICIDTAHIALNKENIMESMEILAPYSQRIHFANAILLPESEFYGDKHLPMGAPGFLTTEVGKDIIENVYKSKFFHNKIYTAIEVRGTKEDDLFELEAVTRKFLSTIIEV